MAISKRRQWGIAYRYRLSLFNHPLLHRPRFRREVHAYQVKLAPICLEGAGILVVLDLTEGFLGGLVELQFNDIDVIFRLDSDVHTPLAGGLLYLYVVAQHSKNQVESVLEWGSRKSKKPRSTSSLGKPSCMPIYGSRPLMVR